MDGHPIPGDYTEPPPPLTSALVPAGVGVFLSATAFAGTQAGLLPAGPAALLASAGMIVAGASLTLNPKAALLWVMAFFASMFAAYGYSTDWDSMRLFAAVMAGVSVLGLIVSALPTRVACVLGIGWLLFHFTGVLSAILLPPPQPWLGNQLWTRLYRPYLQFIYMNNAYQFYSPDPGPASELWWCVKYEKIDPTEAEKLDPPRVHRWVKMPSRSNDFRDPLGMVYFRRLAITEQLAAGKPFNFLRASETEEIFKRRQLANNIKDVPDTTMALRYRPPQDYSQRFVLSAFAAVPALEHPRPDPEYFDGVESYRVASVNLYRVEHQIVAMPAFVGVDITEEPKPDSDRRTEEARADRDRRRIDPWYPTLYFPFFMGEYVPEKDEPGRYVLKSPTDPMLYWLVPILAKPGPTTQIKSIPPERYTEFFDDNVITHAGSDHRLPDGGTSGRKSK